MLDRLKAQGNAFSSITPDIISNVISVNFYSRIDEVAEAAEAIINEDFLKTYPDFEELLDLREFSRRRSFNIHFYINRTLKSAYIFIFGSTLVTEWHFIQSLISRLLPWYFDNNPLADDERELLESLTKKTSVKYLSIMKDMAKKHDLHNKQIEYFFCNIGKNLKKRELISVRNSIQSRKNELDRCLNQYKNLLSIIDELRVKESGLKYQMENTDYENLEIVNFLKNNQHIKIIEVVDNDIKIIIDTTLENYDPDMFEQMYKNTKSYLYNGYSPTEETFINVENRKKMLNAIFGEDALLKIKVCAYYLISLSGWAETSTRFVYPEDYNDFLVNPHIKYHACMGNNAPVINKYLSNGDYVSAIAQCQVSAMNLNLSEGVQTVAPFLEELFAKNCGRVILMPDGTSCTPKEAYNRLFVEPTITEENKQED